MVLLWFDASVNVLEVVDHFGKHVFGLVDAMGHVDRLVSSHRRVCSCEGASIVTSISVSAVETCVGEKEGAL